MTVSDRAATADAVEIIRPWAVPGLASRLRSGRSLARAWMEFLVDELDATGLVLDFGGGGSQHWAGKGKAESRGRLVSLDIRPSVLPDVVADGGRGLPFRTGSFDRVIAFNTLEHVAPVDALVCDLVRVLRPGGRIVVFVPFLYQRHTYRSPELIVEDHHRFGPVRLLDLLRSAGCEGPIRIQALDGGPFTAAAHAAASGLPVLALRPLVYHAGMLLDRLTVDRRAVREARDEWPLAYWVEAVR